MGCAEVAKSAHGKSADRSKTTRHRSLPSMPHFKSVEMAVDGRNFVHDPLRQAARLDGTSVYSTIVYTYSTYSKSLSAASALITNKSHVMAVCVMRGNSFA